MADSRTDKPAPHAATRRVQASRPPGDRAAHEAAVDPAPRGPLDDATALARRIRSGERSADECLDAALARAAAVDPALTAIAYIDESAARRHIESGLPDGPFSGVPFLLKDIGCEAIDFPASSGSRLLMDTRFAEDSTIFKRIRRTGLVTFGRSTSPEGAVGPVTEATRYGAPTRNPWNLACTPGGSSGGAAAAVAAGIVPAAHGSDGGGSIRIPAACCGLIGFKATRARLPDGPDAGEGWAGMAIDGFLTRSVRDTASLLDATAGPDLGAPYHAPPLPEAFLDAIAEPPPRLRIALCTETFDGEPIHADCRAALVSAAARLEALGHTIEPARPDVGTFEMMGAWTVIVACGTALWVRLALERQGLSLDAAPLEPMTRGACEYAASLRAEDYLHAVDRIHAYGRRMARFFESHDLLLSATLAEPPATIGRFAPTNPDFVDYRTGPDGVFAYSPFTAPFNASGQPAVSLPVHWNAERLPIGVQLAARFGDDTRLLAVCAELEAAGALHLGPDDVASRAPRRA